MMKKSFKKVLVLCMAFAMMFLTGCENNGFGKVADGVYDNNGLPVYININNTCSQYKYDNLISALNNAPEYLRRNCTGVYLALSDDFYQEFRRDQIAAGFANSDTHEIYLNNTYADNSGLEGTVIHELAHVYDFTHGTATLDTSYTPEFLALYEAEKYNVNFDSNNEYYQNSNQEFFAECFSYYVLEPERLPTSLIQYYDSLPK